MSEEHDILNEHAPAGLNPDPTLETGATAATLTPRQLEILQHSLGVDRFGQGPMYRGHFCAGADDEPVCRELVAMGYMRVFHPNESPLPYYNCSVTQEGKAAVLRESPKPPKLTRSQKRYRQFLDADSGVSFMEWLKWMRL